MSLPVKINAIYRFVMLDEKHYAKSHVKAAASARNEANVLTGEAYQKTKNTAISAVFAHWLFDYFAVSAALDALLNRRAESAYHSSTHKEQMHTPINTPYTCL